MTQWIDPQPTPVPDALHDLVGGHPLVATTLARRGITSPDVVRAFLDPTYYPPAPAADLPDIGRAAERIWQAIESGDSIGVWGDFDVDGQTATAVLVEALRDLGADKTAPLRYRVPARDQGHGLHLPSLEEWFAQGLSLLITCDTGVDAFAAIERASAHGCDVVVTDHHDLPPRLPPAHAIVNPKRLPIAHPLRELPGVGAAYKLVEYLFQQSGHTDKLDQLLDLVALGIVADVSNQVADVRYLLQRGLTTLRNTQRVGLQMLIAQTELYRDGLTEEHIGYQLAPRLNALGRLGDANLGVELLLTQDVGRARMLAAETDGLNFQRRLITGQTLQAALDQIERHPSLLDYQALVVAGHNWHPGVIGLVAGRLVKEFERPAVVLSFSQDGPARGSARSVPGCDINAALTRTGDWLLSFGGHPGAAGLALDPENVDAFRKALSRAVADVWDADATSPGLQIDAYVGLDDLSLELVSQLERLAPFGPGNPPVQLATRQLHIVSEAVVGRNEEHRRVVVADENERQQTVLWWHGAGQPLPPGPFDLAYALRANDYRGQVQLQVEWVDARPHGPVRASFERSRRKVVDWREESDPGARLTDLRRESEEIIVVWAEGEHQRDEPASTVDRMNLAAASILVIWTPPPGPAELASALQVVHPSTVYVVGHSPPVGRFRPFVERLAGMVKHDLRARGGRVDIPRLAAALAHREETVRAGLAWLVACGRIGIVEEIGDAVVVRAGGESVPDLPDVQAHLRDLLDETAAYRRHWRSAPIDRLAL